MYATALVDQFDSSSALLDANDPELQFPQKPVLEPRLRTPTLAQIFRHSHWADQRDRMFHAMAEVDLPSARLTRYAHCGTACYVMQSDDDPNRYTTHSDTCHDRWCSPCAAERARTIATRIRDHITGKTIRMLTLTLKHSPQPLPVQLDRLHDALKTLRRTVLWKTRVTGGCSMFECKWSARDQAWHPHAHLLLEGRFIPHQQLKSLWYKITGDSYIIHIRPCDCAETAAKYVAKYVGKPWTGDVEREPRLIHQLIPAFESRRLCHTFGTWRGIPLTEPLDTGTWHRVCTIDELLLRAKRGQQEAVSVLGHLASRNTPAALLCVPDPPPTSRDPPPTDTQTTLLSPMPWTEKNPR